MNIIQRISREPVLLIGALTALFGVLLAFGLNLTEEQIGAIVIFVGAVMALIRFLVTPSSEVIAQRKAGETGAVAGKANQAGAEPGQPVAVSLTKLNP